MEARRHMKFTGGRRVVATVNQMDSAYYKAGGGPFVAAGIMGSTRSPPQHCSRRRSPHHHRIFLRIVDLVEARHSGVQARGARCVRVATPSGGYAARLGHRWVGHVVVTLWAMLGEGREREEREARAETHTV
jgi:hypothetical protein